MVALFGRANWWLPSWLARVLRIPAPVPAPAVPVPAVQAGLAAELPASRTGGLEVSGVR